MTPVVTARLLLVGILAVVWFSSEMEWNAKQLACSSCDARTTARRNHSCRLVRINVGGDGVDGLA